MKLKGIELEGAYKVVYDTRSFLVYNEKGNAIYLEDNNDYWDRWKYDKKGNIICYENSYGFWYKSEYDEKGNEVYFENSNGKITDKRVKELTIEEIEKLLGYKIKIRGE